MLFYSCCCCQQMCSPKSICFKHRLQYYCVRVALVWKGCLSDAAFKPNTMVYTQIRAICTHAVLHLSIRDCANRTCCTCSILSLIFQFLCNHNMVRLKLRLNVSLYHLRKRSVMDLFSWYSLLYSQNENHFCFFFLKIHSWQQWENIYILKSSF